MYSTVRCVTVVALCAFAGRRLNVPREVVPNATVRQATAALGVMPGLASTHSAAAGMRNAAVWMAFLTRVMGRPHDSRASARRPAVMLPTAMTWSQFILSITYSPSRLPNAAAIKQSKQDNCLESLIRVAGSRMYRPWEEGE